MYGSNVQAQSNFTNELNQCNYDVFNREFVVRGISAITQFPKKKNVRFLKVRSGRDTLIQVNFGMTISFQNRNFDIPLKCIFPKNYPADAPQISIEIQPGTGINAKNNYLNPQTGAVVTPTLARWSQANTLFPVLDEIQDSFTKCFPIYKLKKNQQPAAQPQPGLQRTSTYSQQPQPNYYSPNTGYQPQPSVYNTQNYYNNQMSRTAPLPQSNIYSPATSSVSSGSYNPGMNSSTNSSYSMGGYQPNTSYNPNSVPQSPMNYAPPPVQNNQPSNNNQNKKKENEQTDEELAQNPEYLMKKDLLEIVKNKLESRVNDEQKKMLQQNNRLKTYQKHFASEIEKLNTVLNNKDQLEANANMELNNLNQELMRVQSEIASKGNQGQITGENAMNFVNLKDKDNKLIELIARETYYEDLISAIKKAFRNETLNFNDSLKYMRLAAREELTAKYLRRQMLKKH